MPSGREPLTCPATSATGTPAAAAAASTVPVVFPVSEVGSNLPSPVMTRSAPVSARPSPARRDSSAAPGVKTAPQAAAGSPPSTSASRARPASRRAICAASAPFCGPNTAAAPRGPSSGAVTSARQVTPSGGGGRSRLRSALASAVSAPPPGGSGCPAASRNRAPSAASAPAPPSVEAEPPSPARIRVAPESSARPRTSPSPVVWAPIGSGRASSGSPLARASSTTATRPGSRSQRQRTGSPPGPVTWAWRQRAPATVAASTSRVPSPPSARGSRVTWSPGRTASQPAASAAAAAAAVALPLNESGAISTRTAALPVRAPAPEPQPRRGPELPREPRAGPGSRFVRGQPELVPDFLLDLVLAGRRVDHCDALLAPEQVEHRVGLLVILAQPHDQGFLGVVLPGDQVAAAHVADALGGRAALDQVVVHAAVRAQPAGQHPAAHLGVGQVQVDDPVDVVALQEELRLPGVAGEAVDDEPVVPVVLGEPCRGHLLGQVVPDQLPGRHDPPHLGAHLGVVLYLPAEDVADADVYQVQVRRQDRGLGALPAAGNTDDHVFPHAVTFAYGRSAGHVGQHRPAQAHLGRCWAAPQPGQRAARPSSLAAFCFRIFSLTSGLIGSFAKSASQRSGVSSGKPEPNMTLSASSEFAYCTRIGGKYFGDQPDRSMCTCRLCRATASASSCQGNDGWARMMGMPGKSAATSSISIGLEYFSRIPPPPGSPAPMPVWPVWNSVGTPSSSIAAYSGYTERSLG